MGEAQDNNNRNVLLVDDSEVVVDKLKSLGYFDEIRRKMSEKLSQHEGMKRFMEDVIQKSKVLKNVESAQLSQRELFQKLREDIESKLIERAGEFLWEILTNKEFGISDQLDEKLFEALKQVHLERKNSVEDMKADHMAGSSEEKAKIYAKLYKEYQDQLNRYQTAQK